MNTTPVRIAIQIQKEQIKQQLIQATKQHTHPYKESAYYLFTATLTAIIIILTRNTGLMAIIALGLITGIGSMSLAVGILQKRLLPHKDQKRLLEKRRDMIDEEITQLETQEE